MQTGSQWCLLEEYENAEACYSKSMPCAATWKTSLTQATGNGNAMEDILEDLFGLLTMRMTAAWRLDMQVSLGLRLPAHLLLGCCFACVNQ